MPSVYLAVPTRGEVNSEVAETHHQIARNLHTTVAYQRGGNSVASNRNMIVKHFLESDAEVLMMIDDDIGVPPHAQELPGKLGDEWDVVGAACPIFVPARWPIPVYAAFVTGQPGKYKLLDDRADGLMACDGIGTGCVVIHRRVFDRIPAQPFQETIQEDHIVSEDIAFCLHCNQAGVRMAVDFATVCDHVRAVSLLEIMRGIQEVHRQNFRRLQAATRTRLADEFGMVVAPTSR